MEIDNDVEELSNQMSSLRVQDCTFPVSYHIFRNGMEIFPDNLDSIMVNDVLCISSEELYKITHVRSIRKLEPVFYIGFSQAKGRCIITLVPLYKNSSIGIFMGALQSKDEPENDYTLEHVQKDDTIHYINPTIPPDKPDIFYNVCFPNCCAGLMNDGRSLSGKPTEDENNCCIGEYCIVRTKRDIYPHEELCIPYGNQYWNQRLWKDPLMKNEIVVWRENSAFSTYLREGDTIELEDETEGTNMYKIFAIPEPFVAQTFNLDDKKNYVIDLMNDCWLYHRSMRIIDCDTQSVVQSPKMILDFFGLEKN